MYVRLQKHANERKVHTNGIIYIGSLICPSPHYSIVAHLTHLGRLGTQFPGWLRIPALTILYFFDSLLKRDIGKFGSNFSIIP